MRVSFSSSKRVFESGPEVTFKPSSLPGNVWESVSDETRREALTALSVLDSEADPDFDRLTRLAASLFNAEVSLVSLVDLERQWFKSCYGLEDRRETPVDMSFCAHLIAEPQQPFMVINDALKDERFARNPLVTGSPFIRFYAGAPIVVRGQRLGTLCVFSSKPRDEVSPYQLDQLVALADTASSLFTLKEEARAQARTAAALVKEEWRHALTLEAGKVGSWVWDVRSGEVVVNDIMRRMFGLGPTAPVVIEDIFERVHIDDIKRVREAFRSAFDEGQDYDTEFRVPAANAWMIGRGRVYQRDGNGKPLIVMGVCFDITETRAAADQMRVLLRELNHRVKNTLAMIQSIARQTLRSNPDPKSFLDAFSGRLRTLSDAHTILSDRDWSGIRLLELIDAQVAPHLTESRQLIVSGSDVDLPPDHALGLGLILHELSSNAAKYGALSRADGRVEIGWSESLVPERRITLNWKETNGPEVARPKELGFGGKLIERSLAKVLDSSVELTFPSDGVSARISFPLPA
jgi:two-component sensor histidine kinase